MFGENGNTPDGDIGTFVPAPGTNGNGNGANGANGSAGTNGKAVVTPNGKALANLGVALFPVTPVPFSRWEAWLRIGIYGTVAMATWKRMRMLSYVAMGAAGLSALTSLGSNAWQPKDGQ